jgi:uncharacterized protein (DUF433 family)
MSTPIKTDYKHIELDSQQRPIIAGTRMKVSHLVIEHLTWGWSPEELAFQHPHLTLGQVYSALAYYWDHQAEMDAQIAREEAEVERLLAAIPEPPALAKLRAAMRS